MTSRQNSMNFMKESNIKKGLGALMQPEILNKVSRDRGNFEFRANVEMNIYYNNNSDESYEVEGGLSGVIVEPLNEYEV